MKFRNVLIGAVLAIVALTIIAPPAPAQVTVNNARYANIALDSALATTGTKNSYTVQMFGIATLQASGTANKYVKNYGLHSNILVTGKQNSDTVHAMVYLNFGRITGGTAKRDYKTILVDSLTIAKPYALIDLAGYWGMPEVSVTVTGNTVGYSSGNGVNAATWSAFFSGIGYATFKDQF